MKLKSLLDTSKESGVTSLSNEQQLMFMQLTAMEMEDPNWEMSEEDANCPWMVLMRDRLKKAGCEATNHLLFYLSTLCTRPEDAIMWAYTICHMAEKSGQWPTLDLMTMRFFQKGLPGEEAYRACWRGQKVQRSSMNLMDRLENWFDAPNQADGPPPIS